MAALVLKAWRADTKPIDPENNYVRIVGRRSGILAWLLSLIGVDPITQLVIGIERIEFTTSSLSGTETRLIPLECISSTYYGYYKPWKVALSIVLACVFFGSSIAMSAIGDYSQGGAVTALLYSMAVGLVIGIVYYFLHRTLTLGFVEHSGLVNGIQFKRSVIEGVDINQEQGASVCVIAQRLIEAKQKRTLQGIRP